MSENTTTSMKYIDRLKQTKEQRQESEMDSLVAHARANFARTEADLMASIADCERESLENLASVSLNIAAIIESRRTLKALREDLADVKALATELL